METEFQALPCPACGSEVQLPPGASTEEITCPHCGHRFIPSSTDPAPFDETEQQIADLAIRLKLLTPEQAAVAASLPKSASEQPGARFIAAGVLTAPRLARLVSTLQFKEKRVEDNRFGALAIHRGWATPEQITDALEQQKQIFMRDGSTKLIGALLVKKEILTQAQCDELLAEQGRARLHEEETEGPDERAASARILVASDHLSATLMVDASGTPPSVDELRKLLDRKHVTHGIDEEALRAVAEGRLSAANGILIAKATEPVPPVDGRVEYLFQQTTLKAGHANEEGLIDFRDRGEIPQVTEGTELARHIPAIPGQAGVDVFGHSTLTPRAKDNPLRAGKGVSLSSDKTTAIANENGFPSISATGVISVLPEYRIEGDVDFGTGNINFHGRVVVTGTVRARFHVRCGELVANEIEAAVIDTEGDITANGGIIGAQIHCGGTLRALYLQRAKVEVLGDVLIAREVVDSEVEAAGAFSGKQCVIRSSRISVMGSCEAREIGSETSLPCRIVSGVDEKVQRELVRQQEEIDAQIQICKELEKHIAEGLEKHDFIAAELVPVAQEQDQAQKLQRELEEEKGAAASAELATLAERIKEVEAQLEILFTKQDSVDAQVRTDKESLAQAQALLATQQAELAQFKEWAAERIGNFRVNAEIVHQQTILKGPHLEAKLDSDRRVAKLVERALITPDGRSVWHFVSV